MVLAPESVAADQPSRAPPLRSEKRWMSLTKMTSRAVPPLRTPTAQEFKTKLLRPFKIYHRKVLNHTARVAVCTVTRRAQNMSEVGRALCIQHHPTRKAVLNLYEPPGDVSRDFGVLRPDFRIEFPPIAFQGSRLQRHSERLFQACSVKLLMESGIESDEDEDRYTKLSTSRVRVCAQLTGTRRLPEHFAQATAALLPPQF
ncbi:hypothetical protein C8R43DRAFT_950831 [Mycena crocata]|nr:hypothetical protein C8R43DRAFT_950831 [Mycena crocata]